jgi:hypothetical protein
MADSEANPEWKDPFGRSAGPGKGLLGLPPRAAFAGTRALTRALALARALAWPAGLTGCPTDGPTDGQEFRGGLMNSNSADSERDFRDSNSGVF